MATETPRSEHRQDREDVPLFRISWDRDDVLNVVDSVTRGGYWAKGPYVREFEERLESYHGVEHAVTVNSGTTALVVALEAHGVGPGDEVVVPAFTFPATVHAVEAVGATPAFADVERETYGLDPAAAEAAMTPDTAAILPIHCYGLPCQIARLRAVADDHGVSLVEDAAEAQGAAVDGRRVGSFGDSAALSFCQNKIVATGEGGAVLTDDPEVAAVARQLRDHGRDEGGEMVRSAGNYRMPDVAAALGCGQMDHLEGNVVGRQRAAARLTDWVADVDGVAAPPTRTDATHVYQLFTVTVARHLDRDALQAALDDRGVASKTYWTPPVHRREYRLERGDDPPDLPVSEDLARRVLSLPIHPDLDDATADRVGRALHDAVAELRS